MEKLHRKGNVQKATEVVSAKPVLGLPLGNTKLTFRYADQSALEFEGFISDVTGLFVNPEIQDDFKRVVLEEITFLKANSFNPIEPEKEENETQNIETEVVSEETVEQNALAVDNYRWKRGFRGEGSSDFEKSALQKAIQAFKDFDFSEACRVLLLESGSTLHLILQVGRINLLTTYANNIDHSQWSLLRGLKYDFLVSGSAATLPNRQQLHELGVVFMHIFIPDDFKTDSKLNMDIVAALKPLLAIIPFVPGTVDIDETLKSMKKEIDIAQDASKLATERISEKSVRNEAAKLATASYEENSPEDFVIHSRFDFTDALLLGAPTFGGSLLAWLSFDPASMGWVGGLGIGFILGCFLVSRRK